MGHFTKYSDIQHLTMLMAALLSVVAINSQAQLTLPSSGIINSIAGNGTQASSGDGGLAINAEFTEIVGVAADGNNNIYVLDQCRVREISAATGIITTVAGNGTCGYLGDGVKATTTEIDTIQYHFGTIGAMTVDYQGNIYISGFDYRIRKVTASTGIISTIAGTGVAGFSGDGGPAVNAQIDTSFSLAADTLGNIFLTDSVQDRVRMVSQSTGLITTVAGNGSSTISGDGGLATNAGLGSPGALAADNQGNFYVEASSRVRKVNALTHIITTIAGTGASGYSGDNGPALSAELGSVSRALAVDSFRNVYIDDIANNRVRVVNNASGVISTVAGNGTFGFSGDGGASTNAEVYPYGIAVDRQGSIYICASSAFRLRVSGGNAVTGVINPKYAIVGVTYAPPGPGSYVQYTNSTYVGSTTNLSNSFTANESLSVSIGAGIDGWGPSGMITGTSTTSTTQALTNASTVTVSTQTSLSDKTTGTPNAFSPVDHDYDIIWLWLNPLLVYTVSPSNPNSLTWNGYGYDTADNDIIDVYPVYVGELNGHFSINPSTTAELSRSWAKGQIWPTGQGPALTTTDYAAILGADPFSNVNYTVNLAPGVSPGTTTDGRFTLSGGTNGNAQDFVYVQAPNNGGAVTQQYMNTYTNMTTLAEGSTYTYQQTFGLEEKYGGTLFGVGVTNDLKQSQSLTWVNSAQTTITNTTTETDLLSITGPTCTGTPCNPSYSGPPAFSVFQDNLYGTFMFNPIN